MRGRADWIQFNLNGTTGWPRTTRKPASIRGLFLVFNKVDAHERRVLEKSCDQSSVR